MRTSSNIFRAGTVFDATGQRYVTRFDRFGLTYACQEVRDAQEELQKLLAQAKAAKLLITHLFSPDEGHPIAVGAQTLFNQVVNDNLVIVSDDACAQATAQLKDASAQLRALLAAHGTGSSAYIPPADSPYVDPNPDTLDKLKPLFIAGAVVAGVVLLVPVVFEAVSIVRTVRRSRRRYSGRRR